MLGSLLVVLAAVALGGAVVAVVGWMRGQPRAASPRSARALSIVALGLTVGLGIAWATQLTAKDDFAPVVLILSWPVVCAALPAITGSRPRAALLLAWLGVFGLIAHVAIFGLGFGLSYLLPAVVLLGAAIAWSSAARADRVAA